ncbi:MAG: hypothetical protein M3068_14970 [Gemmatimonadota bacterium]|nr:hypothetical protein [Gemmatimonadota bacterium]
MVLGSTTSWFEGDEVQLDYTKQFECKMPPSAGAASGCEMGDKAQTEPANDTDIPVLYVMVPLEFTPAASTLHCPTAGNCVAHPSTLDMTRVFGAGTANAPLPPHSHIIIDIDNHKDGPWKVEVIGVKNQATWDLVVGTKNLAEVRLLQFQDPSESRITADISTNIFLFFQVR